MVWTEVISFGLGVVMRIWNEERRAKQEDEKLRIAAMTANAEILKDHTKSVVGSTFLQTMMMFMVFTALGVLVMFPLIAVFFDVPLFVLHTYIKETGILFWKSTQTLSEWMTIEGLYLPEEFQVLIIEATKFIFGAVVGGLGRR